MNYEQKYKEALKWMQGLYSGLHGATKEEAERYFPELKESEDERIRKWLTDWARAVNWSEQFTITKEQVIAWLEKQGNTKDPCTNCINDKGCVTCENGELKETTPTKMVAAADVIEWLNDANREFWLNPANPYSIVEQFKKDFGL